MPVSSYSNYVIHCLILKDCYLLLLFFFFIQQGSDNCINWKNLVFNHHQCEIIYDW